MKKHIILFICFSLWAATSVSAQTNTQPQVNDTFKKFYWGFTFNNYWASIEGNNALPEYFYKPSLGGSLKTEYYFAKFFGISAGVGYQQRGAGIKNNTNNYELVNPSIETYRTRLRFNSIDVPLTVIIRTPNTIKNGIVRLTASAGINPQFMFKATQIRHSVEDGFHDIRDKTELFNKSDIGFVAGAGADINTGGCVFQVHLVGNWGSKNVFNNQQAYPSYIGKNRTYGIRLGFLF